MIPKYRFFKVTIQVEIEDENTGKFKKCKEVHLVDAKDINEVVSKVEKEMQGYLRDWYIVSISISNIDCVYS